LQFDTDSRAKQTNKQNTLPLKSASILGPLVWLKKGIRINSTKIKGAGWGDDVDLCQKSIFFRLRPSAANLETAIKKIGSLDSRPAHTGVKATKI
jgi:hypothetical protein